jgi:hypothetical protein
MSFTWAFAPPSRTSLGLTEALGVPAECLNNQVRILSSHLPETGSQEKCYKQYSAGQYRCQIGRLVLLTCDRYFLNTDSALVAYPRRIKLTMMIVIIAWIFA